MHDEHRERRRFWARVRIDASGCWLWTGGTRSNGYGTFAVRPNGEWTQTTAHRFAYLDQVGEIPAGYEIDHLCCVRNCVRPDHLEAVTLEENRKRRDNKTVFNVCRELRALPVIPPKPAPPAKLDRTRFCKNGHEYAVVGKLRNGTHNGKPIFTCAACREVQMKARLKHNKTSARPTCPKGHPYEGDNLWVRTKLKNGKPYQARECRACTLERNRLARSRGRNA